MNEQFFTSLNGYEVKDKYALHTYDSVALMKGDTKLKEGMQVKTKGYYNANDGGQGEYIIVDDNTLIPDNGSIHLLTNNLYAVLISNDIIYPEIFGCVTTEDTTTQMQKCIDYAISNNKLIKFNNNYTVQELTINGFVEIDGNNKTLFRNAYEGNSSRNIFNITSYCILKNINFNSEQIYTPYVYVKAGETTEEVASNIYAFEVRGVNKLIIENCTTNHMSFGLFHESTNITVNNIKTLNMEMGIYLQDVQDSYFDTLDFKTIDLHKYYHDFYIVDSCDNVYFNNFTHINDADYSDIIHLYTTSEEFEDNKNIYFNNFKIETTGVVRLAQCNSGICKLSNGYLKIHNNNNASLLSIEKGNIIFDNCYLSLYGAHNDYVENAIFNNCKIDIDNITTGYRLFVKSDINNTIINCNFDVNISNCNIYNTLFNGVNYRLYFNDGLDHEVKYNTFIGTFTSQYFVYNGNNEDFTKLRFLNNRITNPRSLYDTNITVETDVSFMYNILK